MNPKTKKIVIIGGTMALLAGLFIYWKKKKAQTSSNAKTTTTTSSTATTASAAPAPTATTANWISFKFYSGQENGNATGIALTNTNQLPKNLGAGSKIEIRMDSESEQTLNGRIVTVKYLGYDTSQGDSSLGYITFDFPTPPNPNKLFKSGSFRVV